VSRREATRLLDEARQLLAAAERRGDAAGRTQAAQRAVQVNDALPARLGRSEALLLAEAYDLSGSVDVVQHNLETGVGVLMASAFFYGQARAGVASQRGAARVARTMASVYAGLGLHERAARFALQHLDELPEGDRETLATGYAVTMFAAAGQNRHILEFLARKEPIGYPEPIASLLLILGRRAGARDCTAERLVEASRAIRFVPSDLRVQATLFAASALLARDPAAAAEMLAGLRTDLRLDPVTDARVAQALGTACARAGDADAALGHHLLAWTRYDGLRYRIGSLRFRRAVDVQMARCRAGALAAAAHRRDCRLLLELIEASRLQATVDLSVSAADLDEALGAGRYRERAGRPGTRKVEPDLMPDVYHETADELMGARLDVTDRVAVYVGGVSRLAATRAADGHPDDRNRLDVGAVIGRHARPADLWWSTWYERGKLYWVLSSDGAPIDGGAIDVVGDEPLCVALSLVSLRARVDPPWPVSDRVAGIDVDRYLTVADDPEERELAAALARVLPVALLRPGDPGRRLFLSVAPELAPVPWPIVALDQPPGPATRLIERFELRFLPSLAILDRVASAVPVGAGPELPFLLSCDYFPAAVSRPPARKAQTTLAAHEATTMNVLRFLRVLPPGADGMAFFRTHYEWVDADPGSSGIALADEILPSGMLAARDEVTGRTLLGLPSTVVMSCCSTSGSRERNGGESLGLAPIAMLAGARRLIVTAVEIRHTAFTVVLDDMLIDLALRRTDHFAELRALQLRLLDDWRRGDQPVPPTPEIWAQYQAFGV
jgi:hypothetical protein